MDSFVNSILNPFNFFWLLLAVSCILLLGKKQIWAKRILWIAITWMLIISFSPFSQWVISTLENRYSSFLSRGLSGNVHILVLGGGHSIAPDLPPASQLTPTALSRLAEGIRLYRQNPGSKLVCSGYSSSGRTTQAQMLANAAVDLGVMPIDTIQSRSPQNTAAEIHAYKQRFGNNTTLVVVTSAYHMPRAMLLCEKEGLKPIPAPTDFYIKKDPLKSSFDFQPYSMKIVMLEIAFHEYAGILKVKWFD